MTLETPDGRIDLFGEYPPVEFSDEEKKNLLEHLLADDHYRTHQRKNEAVSRQVRDSLTQRMLLNESAQEWVRAL